MENMSLEAKEKELEQEEERLKEKRQLLEKEKQSDMQKKVEACMFLGDEEKKRIMQSWARMDEAYEKAKKLYKLEKMLREEIQKAWALGSKENTIKGDK